MRYMVTRGFCLGGGIDLHPGQIAEIEDRTAAAFIIRGCLQPAPEEPISETPAAVTPPAESVPAQDWPDKPKKKEAQKHDNP